MSSVPNRQPNVIAASGAVTPAYFNNITAVASAALTLAAPTADGQECYFIDESGHAHTIVISAVGSPPTSGLNGGGVTTLTFNGTKGSSCKLASRGLNWFAVVLNGVALS